jgi:hypothetical protein
MAALWTAQERWSDSSTDAIAPRRLSMLPQTWSHISTIAESETE